MWFINSNLLAPCFIYCDWRLPQYLAAHVETAAAVSKNAESVEKKKPDWGTDSRERCLLETWHHCESNCQD